MPRTLDKTDVVGTPPFDHPADVPATPLAMNRPHPIGLDDRLRNGRSQRAVTRRQHSRPEERGRRECGRHHRPTWDTWRTGLAQRIVHTVFLLG